MWYDLMLCASVFTVFISCVRHLTADYSLCAGKLNGYVDQIAGVLTMEGASSSDYHKDKVSGICELATSLAGAADGFEIKCGDKGGVGMSFF
jgi:hypothetical protein